MPDTDTAASTTVDTTEADATEIGAESTTPEYAEAGEPTEASAENQGEAADEDQGDDDEGDTLPRSYVEKLRRENANYRGRARTADRYAKRLHTELVRATDRLADPDRPRVQARTTSRTPTPWPATSTSC